MLTVSNIPSIQDRHFRLDPHLKNVNNTVIMDDPVLFTQTAVPH